MNKFDFPGSGPRRPPPGAGRARSAASPRPPRGARPSLRLWLLFWGGRRAG